MATIQKGDVLIVDLSTSSGREQSGVRPAIAASTGNLPGVIIVIPLTSNIEALRFPHTLALLPDSKNGLKQESVALVFQVRAIDNKRIVQVIGKVDATTRKKIDGLLKSVFRL
jgi:mRNA interferase MazF